MILPQILKTFYYYNIKQFLHILSHEFLQPRNSLKSTETLIENSHLSTCCCLCLCAVSQMFSGLLLLLRSRARLHLKDFFSANKDIPHCPPGEGLPGERPRPFDSCANTQLCA